MRGCGPPCQTIPILVPIPIPIRVCARDGWSSPSGCGRVRPSVFTVQEPDVSVSVDVGQDRCGLVLGERQLVLDHRAVGVDVTVLSVRVVFRS